MCDSHRSDDLRVVPFTSQLTKATTQLRRDWTAESKTLRTGSFGWGKYGGYAATKTVWGGAALQSVAGSSVSSKNASIYRTE